MIINEDIVRQIEEDEMFQMGTKQGLEQGLEKGLEQGLEKGKQKQAIVGIINMANKGFDINMTAEVLEVEPDFVAAILKEYKKKKEIMALLKKRGADVERIAKKLKVSPILVEVVKEDMK